MTDSKEIGLIRVTFFAAFVLLLETVLFHVLIYVHDYFGATLIIGLAVLSIGLGAFVAGKLNLPTRPLFTLTCAGTTIGMYLIVLTLMFYPTVWLLVLVSTPAFFFPAMFISVCFRDYRSNRVYMYDLVGAALGVIMAVVFYGWLTSEMIGILLLLALPLIGIWNHLCSGRTKWYSLAFVYLVPLLVGYVYYHLEPDRFDLFYRINRHCRGLGRDKAFSQIPPQRLAKSYDNLVGRIEVFRSDSGESHIVAWDGYTNDHFSPKVTKDYTSEIEWPLADRRIFYNIVEKPRVFIVGTSAKGVVKEVRRITPLENIYPVEINPAIYEIVQKDFYVEAGKMHDGINTILGNALSVLKSINQRFDIITLINTHSTRNIGYRGGPDFLQTIESYDIYFDCLTDDGYLLFEERPGNRSGELGVYRMINTLWHCLKQRGVENPSDHFLVWDWTGGKELKKNNPLYYVSMVVTKKPIDRQFQDVFDEWWALLDKYHGLRTRLCYLKDRQGTEEYTHLFKMVENGDFSSFAAEDFDATLLTNNRPFAATSTNSVPQFDKLLIVTAIPAGCLWLLFTAGLMSGEKTKGRIPLNLYNVFVGLGYFLIEIIVLQNYQNIFIGPANALVLVLGSMLLGSGIGGLFSSRLKLGITTALLIPAALVTIYLPPLLIKAGVNYLAIKIISVLLIFAVGLLMGVFFPKGLLLSKQLGLQHKVPYLFAIDSVAGSFAVVLALYIGVKAGYQAVIILAVLCYIIAGILVRKQTAGSISVENPAEAQSRSAEQDANPATVATALLSKISFAVLVVLVGINILLLMLAEL